MRSEKQLLDHRLADMEAYSNRLERAGWAVLAASLVTAVLAVIFALI